MPRLLLAAFDQEGLTYVHCSQQLGMAVRVLDCFEDYHQRLKQLYGNQLLHAVGRRSDVADVVAENHFDVGVVHEHPRDFIRSALITQSLRESGLRFIVVVTSDPSKASMYRRCGAHRVIVSESADKAWPAIQAHLPSFATA